MKRVVVKVTIERELPQTARSWGHARDMVARFVRSLREDQKFVRAECVELIESENVLCQLTLTEAKEALEELEIIETERERDRYERRRAEAIRRTDESLNG